MEKLSEDVWIDIFNFLSPKDIENAANSCENWRNIITTTPSLMRKLFLRIDFDVVKGKPWMKLPYQNFYLERFRDKNSDKIEEFLRDIDHLSVNKIFIDFSNFVDVIAILNKFQNLTTLITREITGFDEKDDTKIDLPNLTHLKIGSDSFPLISKIRSHRIEVFFVTIPWHNFADITLWNPGYEKDFGSFLQTCDKLKHFTMNGSYTDEILKIKSQLETFEIIGFYHTLPLSFLLFLESQKSSLKNLTLYVREFDDDIANFIYFEMNLDKLVDFRGRRGQIHKLKKATVKNLKIYSEGNDFEYLKKLFQCCEMLEALDFSMSVEKQPEFLRLLLNLPKLKNLMIRSTSFDILQLTIKFDRLERLVVEFITWNESVKLIRCCPNLTHVKMYHLILTKNDFENIFQDCSKIQEIYLHSIDQEFTDEEIEIYKDVGSKIKLKIETYSKDVIEKFKLCDAKNRLTVVDGNHKYEDRDLFEVCPRILSHTTLALLFESLH